jgi:hypothetical protein
MKTTVFALLISAFFGFSAVAEDKPKMDPKQEKMMEEWKKYATPSEGHKVLDQMKGNWNYTSKFWHTADAKPAESKGSSKMTLILGGRYLEHNTKGTAMGQPFEGKGFTGYDNIKQKYETIWMDNFGTGMMRGTGSFDAASKTLSDSGEMSCAMTPDKKTTYRSDMKIIDKNNMIFTMYGPGEDKKEFKQMELTYKRK